MLGNAPGTGVELKLASKVESYMGQMQRTNLLAGINKV